MELVLVRHGLPADRTEDPNRRDPGLGAIGRGQAAAVSQFLAEEHIDAVVTSPAQRARDTAAPIAAALGLTPATIAELAEFDWGMTDYLTTEELKTLGDYRWQALRRGELYDVDPVQFQARVTRALDKVIDEHPGSRVVVVTHGGVINAYLAGIAGTATIYWAAIGLTGISRVSASRSGERTITTVGETGHLRSVALAGNRPAHVDAAVGIVAIPVGPS